MADQQSRPPQQQDAIPWWLILGVLSGLVLWLAFTQTKIEERSTYLLLLVFGVPAWTFFISIILSGEGEWLKKIGCLAAFFWPATLMLIIWIVRQML